MAEQLRTEPIGEPARGWLEAANYAILAVPRQDGTIQTTVVWADLQGDDLIVNTVDGRTWPANLRRAGTATLTVMTGPFSWVSITARLGRVDDGEVAVASVHRLSRKYLGSDYPLMDDSEPWLKLTLVPERVHVKHRTEEEDLSDSVLAERRRRRG